MTALAPVLQAFFTERLIAQRQVSGHTVAAYRDTFRLLLAFAQERTGTAPCDLRLDDLDAALIGAFLEHLRRDRRNSARTRNARLSTIHSLFGYAALRHPENAALIQRVLAIPLARSGKATMSFLTRQETEALLAAPDRTRWTGRRDHALLALAAQTGLRISELTALTRADVHLGPGPHVRCTGKGRKERCTPVTTQVARALRAWLDERGGGPDSPGLPHQPRPAAQPRRRPAARRPARQDRPGHVPHPPQQDHLAPRAATYSRHGLAAVRRRSGFLWRGRGSGAGDADAGIPGGRLAGFSLAAAPCRRGGHCRGCIRGRVPARWGASDVARPSPLSLAKPSGRAAGLTLGGVVLTVNGDGAVVERQLADGELACPGCDGVLGGWGHVRPRPVRMAEGPDAGLVPRRSRCRGCGATHVLLPAWCLSRRADAGAVIGAALEAAAAGDGHRTIAVALGRPASTVRGWLRRFAARAEAVRAFFTVLLARTSPDPVMPAGAAGPVAAAVSAIAGAAVAVAQRWPELGTVLVWTAASAASGGLLLAPGWPGASSNTS